MAKIKTKKEKLPFESQVSEILENNGISLEESVLKDVVSELEKLFNEQFKPKKKTPFYWNSLVSQYLKFYLELKEEKAAFIPKEAASLIRLDSLLMHRFTKAKPDIAWDEKTALHQHLLYYTEVIKIDFYRKSFCASIIYNNFDMITSQLSDMLKTQINLKKSALCLDK